MGSNKGWDLWFQDGFQAPRDAELILEKKLSLPGKIPVYAPGRRLLYESQRWNLKNLSRGLNPPKPGLN